LRFVLSRFEAFSRSFPFEAQFIPLTRSAPQASGPLDQTNLGAVSREQFRLVLGNVGKVAFEGLSDASESARRGSRSRVP